MSLAIILTISADTTHGFHLLVICHNAYISVAMRMCDASLKAAGMKTNTSTKFGKQENRDRLICCVLQRVPQKKLFH